MHSVLKNYFEPFSENHEIKIGNYVADIVGENGVIEIQTRQFNNLRKKLQDFLQVCDVTVVYPVAKLKWLCWVDNQTGEITKRRKSPRQGTPYEIFFELYKIKDLLKNPRLKFCICMLEIEEYRYLNGWSKDRKKGSSRCDRIPLDVYEEIYINCIQDYKKLLPLDLPYKFTSKDFAKKTNLSIHCSQISLNILYHIGIISRVEKSGNAHIYIIN